MLQQLLPRDELLQLCNVPACMRDGLWQHHDAVYAAPIACLEASRPENGATFGTALLAPQAVSEVSRLGQLRGQRDAADIGIQMF